MVDPLDLIDRFGADALRFTLVALTMPGSDLKLSEARTEGYRHFANKIWNASRFVLMNLENFDIGELAKRYHPEEFSLPDRWIRGRLNKVIREVEVPGSVCLQRGHSHPVSICLARILRLVS